MFLSIFFLPALVMAYGAMGEGGVGGFFGVLLFYTAFFPSGLIAAILGTGTSHREFSWMWCYSAMGYLIYAFCFCTMLSFRKRWQTASLSGLLLLLMALNAAGCRKVVEDSMRGWSP